MKRVGLGPYFNILPIISVALMLVQQKLFTPPPADEQQAMMQKVMTFMMIFIGVIFFKVPAGVYLFHYVHSLGHYGKETDSSAPVAGTFCKNDWTSSRNCRPRKKQMVWNLGPTPRPPQQPVEMPLETH